MADQVFSTVFETNLGPAGSEVSKFVDSLIGDLHRLAGTQSFGSSDEFEAVAGPQVLQPAFLGQGRQVIKASQGTAFPIAAGQLQSEMVNAARQVFAQNRALIQASKENQRAIETDTTAQTRHAAALDQSTRVLSDADAKIKAAASTIEAAAAKVAATAAVNPADSYHQRNIQTYAPGARTSEEAIQKMSEATTALSGGVLRGLQRTIQLVDHLRFDPAVGSQNRLNDLGLVVGLGEQKVLPAGAPQPTGGGTIRKQDVGPDAVKRALEKGIDTVIVVTVPEETVGRFAPFLRSKKAGPLPDPTEVPVQKFTQLNATNTKLDPDNPFGPGKSTYGGNPAVDYEKRQQLLPLAKAIAASDEAIGQLIAQDVGVIEQVEKLTGRALLTAKTKFRRIAELETVAGVSLIDSVRNVLTGRPALSDELLRSTGSTDAARGLQAADKATAGIPDKFGNVTSAGILGRVVPSHVTELDENAITKAVRKGLGRDGYREYRGEIKSPRERFTPETDEREFAEDGSPNKHLGEPVYRIVQGKSLGRYQDTTPEADRPTRVYPTVVNEWVEQFGRHVQVFGYYTEENERIDQARVQRGRYSLLDEKRQVEKLDSKGNLVTKTVLNTKQDPTIAHAYINPEGELEDIITRDQERQRLSEAMRIRTNMEIALSNVAQRELVMGNARLVVDEDILAAKILNKRLAGYSKTGTRIGVADVSLPRPGVREEGEYGPPVPSVVSRELFATTGQEFDARIQQQLQAERNRAENPPSRAKGLELADYYSQMAITARRSLTAFNAEAGLHERAVGLILSIINKYQSAATLGAKGEELLTAAERAVVGLPPRVKALTERDLKVFANDPEAGARAAARGKPQGLTGFYESEQFGLGQIQANVAEARLILAAGQQAVTGGPGYKYPIGAGTPTTRRAIQDVDDPAFAIGKQLVDLFDRTVGGAFTRAVADESKARVDYYGELVRLTTVVTPAGEAIGVTKPGVRRAGEYGPPDPFYGEYTPRESRFYGGRGLLNEGEIPEQKELVNALKTLGLGIHSGPGPASQVGGRVTIPSEEVIDQAYRRRVLQASIPEEFLTGTPHNPRGVFGSIPGAEAYNPASSQTLGEGVPDLEKINAALQTVNASRTEVDKLLAGRKATLDVAQQTLAELETKFATFFAHLRRLYFELIPNLKTQNIDRVPKLAPAINFLGQPGYKTGLEDVYRRVRDPEGYYGKIDKDVDEAAGDEKLAVRAGVLENGRAMRQLLNQGLALIHEITPRLKEAVPSPRIPLPSGADPGERAGRFSSLFLPDYLSKDQDELLTPEDMQALYGYDAVRGREGTRAAGFGSIYNEHRRENPENYVTPAGVLFNRVGELGLRPKGFGGFQASGDKSQGEQLDDRIYRLAQRRGADIPDEELAAEVKNFVKQIRKSTKEAEAAALAATELAAAEAELAAAYQAELKARPQIVGPGAREKGFIGPPVPGLSATRGGFAVETSLKGYGPGGAGGILGGFTRFGEERPPVPKEIPGYGNVEVSRSPAGTYIPVGGGYPEQLGAGFAVTKAPDELSALVGQVYKSLEEVTLAVKQALDRLAPQAKTSGAVVGRELVVGMKRGLRIASPSGAVTEEINPEIIAALLQLVPQAEAVGAALGAALTKGLREAFKGSQALVGSGLYGFNAAGLNYQATKREGSEGGRAGYALSGPGVSEELGARRFDAPSKARDALARALAKETVAALEEAKASELLAAAKSTSAGRVYTREEQEERYQARLREIGQETDDGGGPEPLVTLYRGEPSQFSRAPRGTFFSDNAKYAEHFGDALYRTQVPESVASVASRQSGAEGDGVYLIPPEYADQAKRVRRKTPEELNASAEETARLSAVDADQTARLTRGPLNRLVKDQENAPAAIAAARAATDRSNATREHQREEARAKIQEEEAGAAGTATSAETDLAAVIRRKITALEAQIVATEAATEAEAALAGAAGKAASAKGAGAKAKGTPGPGLSEEEQQRARDQGARRQERTNEQRRGAYDSDAYRVGEEQKFQDAQNEDRLRENIRRQDAEVRSSAYEKYRTSGYAFEGRPGVTEATALGHPGVESVDYTEAEAAAIQNIRDKAQNFGAAVNERALQNTHNAAILEGFGPEKLQEFAEEEEKLIRLSAEQEQYLKRALVEDERYVTAKGEGNAIQAKINALISQSEYAARLGPEGQETSRLNALNTASASELNAQELGALRNVDPDTGKTGIERIAKADAEAATVTAELSAARKQELAKSQEYLAAKTAETAAERELTEALKYRAAAQKAGVTVDPGLTGGDRLAATARLEAQNRAADSIALRGSTEALATANLETALTQQQQKQANAAALAGSEQYLQAEAGATIATQELREAIKYRTLAMRAGETVDPTLTGPARAEAIARLTAAETLDAQTATLKGQLSGDKRAIVLQAEKNLLQEEFNRELKLQMAALRKDPNFRGQIPLTAGAATGGTFFQRLQAQTKNKGGEPANPGDQPTFGQFVGQKFATTFGFLLTGSLLYGGLTAIRSMVEEAAKLQTTLTQVQAEFNSLGQGGEFDSFRDSILAISQATGVSASEVAQVALQFKGAFGSTEEAAKNTQQAIELSVVSGLDLKEITDQLTAAAITYDISVGQIGDKALALQENTGVLAKETITAISQIAEVGKSAGLSFNQLGAIIAVAQQTSGRAGSAIAESFGRVIPAIQSNAPNILRLYESSPELKDQVPELTKALSTGNTGEILINLSRDWDKLSQSQRNFAIETLGGRREAQQIIGVLSNYPKYLSAIRAENQSAGKTSEYFAKIQDNVSTSMKRLQQTFRQIGEELLRGGLSTAINAVIGGLRLLVGVAAGVIRPFAALNEATDGWAVKIALAAVALRTLVQVTKTVQATSLGTGLFRTAAANGVGPGLALSTGISERARRFGSGFFNPPAFGDKRRGGPLDSGDVGETEAGTQFQAKVVSAGEQLRFTFAEIGQQMRFDLGLAGAGAAESGAVGGATAGAGYATRKSGLLVPGAAAAERAAAQEAAQLAAQSAAVTASAGPRTLGFGSGAPGAIGPLGISVALLGVGLLFNQYMSKRQEEQRKIDEFQKTLQEKDNKELEKLRENLRKKGQLDKKQDGNKTLQDENFFERATHGFNPWSDSFGDIFPSGDDETKDEAIDKEKIKNRLAKRTLPVAVEIDKRLKKRESSRSQEIVAAFREAGEANGRELAEDDTLGLGGEKVGRDSVKYLVTGAQDKVDGDRAKLLAKFIKQIGKTNKALASDLKKAAGVGPGALKAQLDLGEEIPLLEDVQLAYQSGQGSIVDYLDVAVSTAKNLDKIINGPGGKNLDPKLMAQRKSLLTQTQQGIASALKESRDVQVSLGTLFSGREDPGIALGADTKQINSKAFNQLSGKDKIDQYQQYLTDAGANLTYLAERATDASEIQKLLTEGDSSPQTQTVLQKLTSLNLQRNNTSYGRFLKSNKQTLKDAVQNLGLDKNFTDEAVKYAADNDVTIREAVRHLLLEDQKKIRSLRRRLRERADRQGFGFTNKQRERYDALGEQYTGNQAALGDLGNVPDEKPVDQVRANQDAFYSALQDNASATRAVAEAAAGKNAVKLAQAAQAEAQANYDGAVATNQSTNEIKKRKAALDQSGAAVVDAVLQAALSRFDLAKALHLAAGDKVAAAFDDLAKATEELNNAIATGGDVDAARANQVSMQAAADEAVAARTRDLANAMDEYSAAQSGDPHQDAQNAIASAQRALDYANAVHDDIAAWVAAADLIRKQRAAFQLQSQSLDVQSSYQQALANYTGDNVEAARLALAEADRHVIETRQNTPNDADAIRAAETNAVTQRRNYFDQRLSSAEDDIQFGLDMEKLSTNQAIREYELLLQGESGQNLTRQQRRDIQRKIKALKDELNKDAQFDVPDNVTLPTLYEARRLRAAETFSNYDNRAGYAGTGGADPVGTPPVPSDFTTGSAAGTNIASQYNDNRSQAITVVIEKDVDADAVMGKVTDAINAPPRLGTAGRAY